MNSDPQDEVDAGQDADTNPEAVSTIHQISVAALFGGPLAGCYLAACNYREFGRPDRFHSTMISGLVGSLVVIGIAAVSPFSLIHLAAVVVATFIVRNSTESGQRTFMNQHLSSFRSIRPHGNVLRVTLLGFAISVVVWFTGWFLIDFVYTTSV